MATLFLGIRFLAMFVALFAVLYVCVKVGSLVFGTNETKKPVRNYKTRFDPVKKKYYIYNSLPTKDEEVTNFFGNRVLYKSKAEAEFVVQKLNEE